MLRTLETLQLCKDTRRNGGVSTKRKARRSARVDGPADFKLDLARALKELNVWSDFPELGEKFPSQFYLTFYVGPRMKQYSSSLCETNSAHFFSSSTADQKDILGSSEASLFVQTAPSVRLRLREDRP